MPPGGGVFEFYMFKIVLKNVAIYISKKGLISALTAVLTGVLVSKIPRDAISNSLPYSHSDAAKAQSKQLIEIDGEDISLAQCHQNFKYLFNVLKDKEVSTVEKQKLLRSILSNHLNLKTVGGRIRFILCFVAILSIFSKNAVPTYMLMMQNLIKAVRDGKISKKTACAIIRRLASKGIPVDPELFDIANDS